jgi:hypothetical protein
MLYTLKSFRAIALVSALTGASILLLSGSAQAATRFHSVATSSYALLPPTGTGSSGSVSAQRGGGNSVTTTTTTTFSSQGPRSNTGEPPIEDPPLPPYNPSGGTATASHTAGHGPGRH